MGCDIHAHIERRHKGQWVIPDVAIDIHYTDEPFEPFGGRNYAVFAFLAGVRNYSEITPLAQPRGIPADASAEIDADAAQCFEYSGYITPYHTPSWLLLSELLAFDYDSIVEDRRDGGGTYPAGQGCVKTYRQFLPLSYFIDLAIMEAYCTYLGCPTHDMRIVFWFDN